MVIDKGSPTRKPRRTRAAGKGRPRAAARQRSPAGSRALLETRAMQGFRMIVGSARRFDAEVRRSAGVPGSLLWALSEIADTTNMSINALAARMALHQTTASNIVNALVARQLVRRRRDLQDHRVVQLQVTAQGTRVLRRAPGPHAGLLVDALKRLAEPQLDSLQASLMLLVAEMRRTARRAAGETLLGE